MAQASDTESRPLMPTVPKQPTNPTSPTAPATSNSPTKSNADPLVELAQRMRDEAARKEQELNAQRQANQSASNESKPLPMYKPADAQPTENEVRSRELLMANPNERKPLGAPGEGLVPDSNPNEEEPLGSFSDTGSWILNTITALGVVIALIFAMRMGMNKLSGRPVMGGRSGIVEVLSRTSLSPRNQVMLLRLGQRIIVVSEGPAGVRTLANVDDPDEVAGLLTTISASKPGSISQSFNQLLNRADTEMDNPSGFTREHGGDDDEHMIDKTRNELSSLLSRIRAMSGGKGGRDA
ncbi:MAG: FliO/MopB family protein [Phycisphaeraceae bacterium JB051]